MRKNLLIEIRNLLFKSKSIAPLGVDLTNVYHCHYKKGESPCSLAKFDPKKSYKMK
jgi:hypothetical protein